MAYTALARKWRPRSFAEMTGQEHVVASLSNALASGRVHHAFLFAGTRGVGKTTVARILAKCLNCERGVSATPCLECASCREIEAGRSIDLIEVDAASRTKVDDTREMLDNVQYAPSRGRYKVYLIDEVHMLSNHSFNALLKTLEEPPPHVKFLLATTDPQKLPVTILSRCLQFNLKNLPAERIADYLKHVLQQEMIAFEEPALLELGRAADGSMRDALSLTDQAIGFGSGKVTEHDVRQMLGSISRHYLVELVEALIASDSTKLFAAIDAMAEHNPDYSSALNELLRLLHRIALAQALPPHAEKLSGDEGVTRQLAARLTAEDLHLYYQNGIHGQRDLPLAPDARAGFDMVMLRMLAFRPHTAKDGSGGNTAGNTEKFPAGKISAATPSPVVVSGSPLANAVPTALAPENWHALFDTLALSGVIRNTAAFCVLDTVQQENDCLCLHFILDETQSALFNASHQERLAQAISAQVHLPVTVTITAGRPPSETPAAAHKRLKAEQQALAEQAFSNDRLVQVLTAQFDGKIVPASVRPLTH